MNMKNIQSSKNLMHVKRLKDGTEIISKNYFDTFQSGEILLISLYCVSNQLLPHLLIYHDFEDNPAIRVLFTP